MCSIWKYWHLTGCECVCFKVYFMSLYWLTVLWRLCNICTMKFVLLLWVCVDVLGEDSRRFMEHSWFTVLGCTPECSPASHSHSHLWVTLPTHEGACTFSIPYCEEKKKKKNSVHYLDDFPFKAKLQLYVSSHCGYQHWCSSSLKCPGCCVWRYPVTVLLSGLEAISAEKSNPAWSCGSEASCHGGSVFTVVSLLFLDDQKKLCVDCALKTDTDHYHYYHCCIISS